MDKMFKNIRIRAISTALPNKIVKLSEYAKDFGKETVDKIIKLTGITEIRVSDDKTTSSDLCISAAQNIFRELEINPSSIDGVVFITQTPDYKVPHTSAIIQDRLGIPKESIVFDINYGCSGYAYGLFQAFLLVESGYCRNVLLCVGDTTTKYIHPEDRSNRMMAGDAGSATLISYEENASNSVFNFFSDGSGAEFLMMPAGGCRMPHKDGVTDIVEYDADGNGMTLENIHMNGIEITTFALREVKKAIKNIMNEVGWNKDDVDLFALHQANNFIVHQVSRQLKVSSELVPVGIQKTGNSAATTIPVMLCNLFPGVNYNLKQVVVCGFGVGLSCCAGTIDLSETKILKTFDYE